MPPRQEDPIMHALFRGISVIPVLTIAREEDAVPLARALGEGGLSVIEVALRSPAATAAIATQSRASCRTSPSAPGRCSAPPTLPRRCMPARTFW